MSKMDLMVLRGGWVEMTNKNRGGHGNGSASSGSAPKGSGGKHRRSLAGRGPTPKAEDRTYHPAYRQKKEREWRQAQQEEQQQRQRKTRVKVRPGNELVVGRNAVLEVAAAGIQIERIFVAADRADGRMREVIGQLANTDAPFVEVAKRDLDVASGGGVHQGVAVEVGEFEYSDLDEVMLGALQKSGPGLVVALDHVTDPHNVGAALRSAAAFGADGIILPERRAAGIGMTAWKVSAGAAAKVPAARVTNLVQALTRCKDAGFFVVGLDGSAQISVRDFPLVDEPLVVVTGAEGKGLSRLVAQTCDQLISIPLVGMESLNAAVATGIALYEIVSRRGENNE